jgi:hypothetical protein
MKLFNTFKNKIMKTSRQSKRKILSFINENGSFDNINNWNLSDKIVWVMNYFNCSKKLAEMVAYEI